MKHMMRYDMIQIYKGWVRSGGRCKTSLTTIIELLMDDSSLFNPKAPGVNKQAMIDWMQINRPMTSLKKNMSRGEVARKVREAQPKCEVQFNWSFPCICTLESPPFLPS